MGEVKKYRNFLGVLYPDAENYNCDEVLEKLSQFFEDSAYILHDMDVNPDTGELKKPHYHWLGQFKNARALDTVSKMLDVPDNSVEPCRKWKSQIRYLIHLDNPEKYQYSKDSIHSTFNVDEFLCNMSESQKISKIYAFVHSPECHNLDNLVYYCFQNGLWDAYRRSASTWPNLINLKLNGGL